MVGSDNLSTRKVGVIEPLPLNKFELPSDVGYKGKEMEASLMPVVGCRISG